jgi:hypothetical protein
VELRTREAHVRMDRISNLYRASLLECVSAESRVRKGKMLQNTSVALLALLAFTGDGV